MAGATKCCSLMLWCHRCETVFCVSWWCFNNNIKKAITALLSHFQHRIPVEKVLPCGDPAVNEFPPHHPLQSPFPPSPSPHNSTLPPSLPPSPALWKTLGIASSLTSLILLNDACLLYCFVQAIIQLVIFFFFLQISIYKKKCIPCLFLYSVILCMMEWAFLILTYMTTVVMGRNVLKHKVKHASDGGTWVCTCGEDQQ